MLEKKELQIKSKSRVRIGTCSWKYDDWKGLIYQESKSYGPFDYLPDYATYYDTVEIDQWFWSLFPRGVKLPDPETARRYAESVPNDFRFSMKVPNSVTLTHYYAKQPKGSAAFANQPNPEFLDQNLFIKFLESVDSMREKLGPIMLQFEYLNKSKMPSLGAFLERLGGFFDKVPREFSYAIECRNPNFLKKEYFEFLRQNQIGCVLLDGYYMPPIGEVTAAHDVDTGAVTVIRLHGSDRSGIEKKTKGLWNQIVEPQEERLKVARKLIEKSKAEVYVNINNHYEGCAPLTIERLLNFSG